jgi:hypothetical protein
MDPVSAFGVASAVVQLAALAADALRGLEALVEQYKHAELSIRSMMTACEAVEAACNRISDWATTGSSHGRDSNPVLIQMKSSVANVRIVMSALQEDVGKLRTPPARNKRLGIRRRASLVWNEQAFKDHRERLSFQIQSLNLLVSVAMMWASYHNLSSCRVAG